MLGIPYSSPCPVAGASRVLLLIKAVALTNLPNPKRLSSDLARRGLHPSLSTPETHHAHPIMSCYIYRRQSPEGPRQMTMGIHGPGAGLKT